jgi:transposase
MDAKDRRIAEQDRRISELEFLLKTALDKIAQLEKNSGNSSKPPSSDIVKPHKNKDRRRKRKIGAQKGHKAQQRQPFADNQIDQTVELKLECCPKCKGKLTVTEQAPKIFQQVELVGRNLIVTEYFRLGTVYK